MKNRYKRFVLSAVSFVLSRAVIVLFFVVLSIYLVLYYQNNMINKAEVSALDDANFIVNEYNHSLDDMQETAKIISALPEVQSKDQEKCNNILQQAFKDNLKYNVVFVTDADGNSYCSSIVSPGINIADRADFQKAVHSGKLSSGGFIIGRITGFSSASFAYPFYDSSHNLIGVVALRLKLDMIRNFSENFLMNKNDQISVTDSNNILLYENSGGVTGTIGAKWDNEIFSQSLSNIGRYDVFNSENRFWLVRAFAPSSDSGIIVSITSPVKSIFLFSQDLFLKFYLDFLIFYFIAIAMVYSFKKLFKIKIK